MTAVLNFAKKASNGDSAAVVRVKQMTALAIASLRRAANFTVHLPPRTVTDSVVFRI